MKLINILRLPVAVIILLMVYSLPSLAVADELSESQEQKQKIEAELKALQAKILSNQRETNDQRKALSVVESELGNLYKDIAQLESKITDQTEFIVNLEEAQRVLTVRLGEKSEEIKNILRLAYKQNNQTLLKLILLGERPENLSRHLYYFSVLTSNQQNVLNQWLIEQTKLTENKARHEQTVEQLQETQLALQKDRKSLESQKKKRQQIIASLQADNTSVTQVITEKKEERERLTALIEGIEAEIARKALEFPEVEAISVSKGQLNWPVSGRLQNQYGKKIDESGLGWQGLLIAAPEGSPVKAVHGGRVVFADFFKSNGLLVIIDHGQGIWTLYGRNRALLTEVGAWVEVGDVIAEVGQSGGYSESGLYFEVRDNGMPINPATWLSKR